MISKHILTELIMAKAVEKISERKNEKPLTTGQYNSVYESIQQVVEGYNILNGNSFRR